MNLGSDVICPSFTIIVVALPDMIENRPHVLPGLALYTDNSSVVDCDRLCRSLNMEISKY